MGNVVQSMLTGEGMWRVVETSAYLKRSPQWVRQRVGAGLMPGVRLGGSWRFVPDEVRAFGRGEWTPPARPARPLPPVRKTA
jgi:hypothetical protein